MAWTYLFLAGLFEIVGVIGLKKTAQSPTWMNQLLLYGGFMVSFRLLAEALGEIPISIAYPVWTGIGTVGAAVVGMTLFREPAKPLRIACIFGIAACVAGLRMME